MANFPFPRELPLSLEDLRNELERVVDRVWHQGLSTAPLDGQDWAPAIDVIDEADAYRIRVEVPGLRAEDVEVTILEQSLMIRGVKPPQPPEIKGKTLRRECRFGSFSRRFDLPSPVDADHVSAGCKLGVLDITVPKAREAQGRSIRIESQD